MFHGLIIDPGACIIVYNCIMLFKNKKIKMSCDLTTICFMAGEAPALTLHVRELQ